MKKDKSCKKPHENLIGKVITAFLMFIPLFAIGVTCGYAMFNKNAYQSYSSSQSPNTYLSNESVNNLTENKIYQFSTDNEFYLASSQLIYINEIVMIKSPNTYTGLNKIPTYFENYINENGKFLHIRYNDNTNDYLKYANTDTTYISIVQFNFVSSRTTTSYNYTNWTKEVIFGKQQSLDNVFYYSIDKVQQNPLFNWTENTAMYTVLHNFTNGLGIQATFYPMLLTYWLMIYLCYILYDFALIPLNIIHRKIHETSETL